MDGERQVTDKQLVGQLAETHILNWVKLTRLIRQAKQKIQEEQNPLLELLLDSVCQTWGISPDKVKGPSRDLPIQQCRISFILEAHQQKHAPKEIGQCINRDRSTISNHIQKYKEGEYMTPKQKADHWAQVIDKYLSNTFQPYGEETLKGIRNTIRETGRVTDKQIQAIKNIRWGKNDETTE